MTEDNLYNIEKILKRRKSKNRLEYKIKWEGYPLSQSTWEPLENLVSAIEYVEEYDKNHPFKSNQKSNKKDKLLGKKKTLKKNEKKRIITKALKINVDKNEKKAEKSDNIEEEKKTDNYINQELKKYSIDDSLKGISKIIKRGETLWASVDKMEKNGEIETLWIDTARLKIDNPWILLDFYEARIKFK